MEVSNKMRRNRLTPCQLRRGGLTAVEQPTANKYNVTAVRDFQPLTGLEYNIHKKAPRMAIVELPNFFVFKIVRDFTSINFH
jgi:hypothetical protein